LFVCVAKCFNSLPPLSLAANVGGSAHGVHVIQSLKDLYKALKTVSHKWQQLRDQLNVPNHVMKATERRCIEDYAYEVLSTWLVQATCPSWKILIDAIEETAKAPNLVKELQDKYKGIVQGCACICIQKQPVYEEKY